MDIAKATCAMMGAIGWDFFWDTKLLPVKGLKLTKKID